MVYGPRACQAPEFEEVISLVNQVFRAGMDQDICTDYPLVFHPSKMEYMRILKVDGKVVSHVPAAPRKVVTVDDKFTIGIISPTVTHPDYRRRAYATLCLQDCVRIMEEEGWVVSVLWTLEATFPFYQQSGWEAVGSQGWVYRLHPKDHELFEAGASDIIRYDPTFAEHLDAIIGMHDAETYRIIRSRAEYQTLFALPKTHTFLAMRGEHMAAYLMFGEGVNKPGLIEGGGDMEGLATLVKHTLTEQNTNQEVQALVPLTLSGLGQLLEAKKPGSRRPIEEAKGVGYQMMRINSLEKLVRQIENHLRRKSVGVHGDVCLVCNETGEAVTLKFRDGDVGISSNQSPEPVVLTRRQLAQLIFGSHPAVTQIACNSTVGEILHQIFPFYFPIWELDRS